MPHAIGFGDRWASNSVGPNEKDGLSAHYVDFGGVTIEWPEDAYFGGSYVEHGSYATHDQY